VDWAQPAASIERRIRAFDPFPGASTRLGETTLKLWRAELESAAPPPHTPCGQILFAGEDGVTIACGNNIALRLTEMQRPGGKRLPAREFLRGLAMPKGQILESAAAGRLSGV
jgi:methionyl-tRNA formyltransferase